MARKEEVAITVKLAMIMPVESKVAMWVLNVRVSKMCGDSIVILES